MDAATRHFAEHGYEDARVADIALALGIAKGSIFQHFGSKDALFLEVYKRAVRSFSKYLDVPPEVREAGFFEVLRYWLIRTEHMVHEDWIPYRIYLLGNYGTDLALKREINRFLISEDPYGRVEFVRFGLQRRELRDELEIELIVSIIDWMVERCLRPVKGSRDHSSKWSATNRFHAKAQRNPFANFASLREIFFPTTSTPANLRV